MKTIITAFIICMVILTVGCLETSTTNELGTSTHNLITGSTIIDVDYYINGLHFTGTQVYNGGEFVGGNGNVEGYEEGAHITGTWLIDDTGIWCYDWYMKVDGYCTQGYHNIGYKTFKGCGNDAEWYSYLTATKEGYKTQYLIGYDNAEWRTY